MAPPASPAAGPSTSAKTNSLQRPDDSDVKPYVISQEIGKGSFATVYKGYHQETHEAVAIKAVSRAILTAKLLENLKSEIDILKQLSYTHITKLQEIVHSPTHIHLIMEYCAGGDLSQYIKKRGRVEGLQYSPALGEPLQYYPHPRGGGLEERCVRCFLRQLGRALKFLRNMNLIHRDIKPQNLLLTPSGPSDHAKGHPIGIPVLKVADFGFARILPNAMMAETLCGSPLYMAPEILRYEKYDAKADLWSVGAVLYEMSIGKPPFRAQNHIELLRKIESSKGIKFPDEDESHPAHPLNPMNPKSPNYHPGMGNTRLEEKMAQVVAPDMKALMRRLLVRNPVERASFEEFFTSEALRNSKFSTKTAPMDSAGLGQASSEIRSPFARPIPKSTRTAPAVPIATAAQAERDQEEQAQRLSPRQRVRLENQMRREEARRAKKEREARATDEGVSRSPPSGISRSPPSGVTITRSPKTYTASLPGSPRTRPQALPEPEEERGPRGVLESPHEAPPPGLLEPKAIPPARVAFRKPSDLNTRRQSSGYGRDPGEQAGPAYSGGSSPRRQPLLETEASIIPGESEEDGRIRQEYVLVGNTKAVEFDRAVDEIRANHRRPLQDRRIPLTPLNDDPPHSPIVDLTNTPQSQARPNTTTFPPRQVSSATPIPAPPSNYSYSPPLAGALARALNIASKKLFGTRASPTTGYSSSPPAKKGILRDREPSMDGPVEDPAEEELLIRLEELAQKTQVLANWADEMYEYVKAIPTKPLPNPQNFTRRPNEPAQAAQRRKHLEVEGEWNAVTCVAVYMLLMGFSQRGIDALRKHQAHLEMKNPDEPASVSEGFEDALIWFKNNFIKCNDRASRVKTWLPVEFETTDCTWLEQLVYDRALQLSRTAARKELLDQATAPDECERLYEESLWCLYALRDEIMSPDNPFAKEDKEVINDWISRTKLRLQRCQARKGMSRPERMKDVRGDGNLEDLPVR